MPLFIYLKNRRERVEKILESEDEQVKSIREKRNKQTD